MSNKLPPIISIILIAMMLIVAVLSLKQESAIMDEVAHIPAGYSYLTQKDMRLNPEHPPLLKDLSAVPLLFIKNINFPEQLSSWKDEINGQWDFGFNFLYNSGNDADKIIFWSRLPMLLLLIILGFYIYRWTKELYGKWTALFAVFLFSFSPTFIAHGRYVTTDVGAATGFFISIYYFVKWVKFANKKNLILAGIFFGLAQLIKFSLFLLVPYFILMLLIWIFVKSKTSDLKTPLLKKSFLLFRIYGPKLLLIFIIGLIIIYPVYFFHTANYPAEKQILDTDYTSSHFVFKPTHKIMLWMVEKPILRPYAQYFLGLFMVFQRATGGNTTFFLGDVTNKGWHLYFPVVYAIKTPLALHILTIIALLSLAWFTTKQRHKKKLKRIINRFYNSVKNNFPEWSMFIFIAIYWASSLTSNLNIGVRHILPTFPFVYLLISGQIKKIFSLMKKKKIPLLAPITIFIVILGWYACSSISIFPYYLTHFNELVGGAKNGHIYVTDSNLDWGQDLKRLNKWLEENNIEKIKVDYFGGATVEYYLGDKYEEWHAYWDRKDLKGSWLAISATFLEQGRAFATKGWDKPTDEYLWTYNYEPVAIIGNSIFVYYIPE